MRRGRGAMSYPREWPDGARQGQCQRRRGFRVKEDSAHLDALSDKVSLLKGLTQEIEGEVAGQNRFLDTMGGGLEMQGLL